MEMIEFPKYLSIQTTSMCNAACIFCPYQEIKDTYPPKVMDMALYKKIIDECSHQKCVERIILYMNNEPLTDPLLIDRINYAKGRVPWASVHLLTNGLLLTESTTERILDSQLDWIGISFHGIRKETIESVMKIPFETAFSRINNFIDRAKTRKSIKDYIMITFIENRYLSAEEKDQAFHFWRARGIDRISCFSGPISRAGNVKDLPKVHRRGKITGCRSIWADEMIHVVEDGKVVLCCMDWRREGILGDLNSNSIGEVWNGKRKEAWGMIYGESDMPEHFLCRRCEEAEKEKLDILLVTTPPWQAKMVPLGVAYLSQFLQSKEVKVRPVDLNVKFYNNASEDKRYFWEIATINSYTPGNLAEMFIKAYKKELDSFVDEVISMDVRVIGFSTTIASTGIAIYLAHQIKQRDPSRITILGGPGCYWNTYILDPEKIVDMFVIGEGELPLLEVVNRARENNSLSDFMGIPGTVICMNKEYKSFLPSQPIVKIDSIPFPEFSGFNLQDYNKGNPYKPIPILVSRGCINKCSFCVDHKMNFPFRIRKPFNVVEEIKFHASRYGVRDFEFNDLLCNGNVKHLEEICDLIIENKLNIRWTSYAAIREGMSPELCKKIHESGCRYICYGMESASDVVLKKMNKRYTSDLAEKVIRNTHNAGIGTGINIIIGHPGESEKEFRKTCAFVERNKDFIDQVTNVSTCFIMLNTELINNLDKFGVYFRRSFRERWGQFLGKKPGFPNYREFCVRPGNTPKARVRWFRRFLRILYKNKITYVILNYVTEHDRDLDKFIKKLKLKYRPEERSSVIKYRDSKIDLSHEGKCKMYHRDKELTGDVGMNVSFFMNERWVDSSTAQWSVKQRRKTIEIRLNWAADIPIALSWLIVDRHKYIEWIVETIFKDTASIFQHKVGMMISNKYSQYTHNNSVYNFPNFITENWEEVMFSKIPAVELSSDGILGSMFLKSDLKNNTFLQIQNAPHLTTRMVNFCLFESNHPAGYNKEGSLFKKGKSIKSRIKIYVKHKE